MNWIVPSNPKIFKPAEAFRKLGYIDWRQNVKFTVGDIVYIYCTKPIMRIMFKTVVEKINMKFDDITDDREFWENKEEYEESKQGKYSRLRLLDKVDTEKLEFNMLMKNGLNGPLQGPTRINEQLNEYINENFNTHKYLMKNQVEANKEEKVTWNFEEKNDLACEREVLSIPAAGTIDLIYKYRIHAHPNIDKSYPYKKALYYTFREKDGWMRKLFVLEKIIKLNPHNVDELNNSNLDNEIKGRIQRYINDRSNSFKFLDDGVYKFYILGEGYELPKIVSLPKQNNHAYFTISEIFSGKDIIERNNKDIVIDEEYENKEYDSLSEGNMIGVKVNKYERNPKARKECLKYYGYKCSVCGFDFEKFYGPIGKEIIEVHHKKALYEIKEAYIVNPIKDLIPVCCNCHTIIHSRNPKFEIEELVNILKFKS